MTSRFCLPLAWCVPLVVVLAALALAPNAGAATFTVTTTADTSGGTCVSGSCSLRQAAAAATANGDTIVVRAGRYVLSNGKLDVTAGVAIEGAGAGSTVIEGGDGQRVMQVSGNTAAARLANLTVTGGVSTGPGGGGIDETGPGPLILDNVTVDANSVAPSVSGGGGGVFSSSGVTLNGSTVTGNAATVAPSTASSGGGGIMVTGGNLIVEDSTINDNSVAAASGVTTDGGGGVFDAGDTGEIVNSTITGNTVTGAGGGGAVLVGAVTGGVVIANATINANGAPAGGAIDDAAGASVNVTDSILAGNRLGGNCAAAVTSDGYNLADDTTCGLTGPGDIDVSSPDLGPLTDNGGPTQTEALLAGSPAIDAGDPAGCTDLLGDPLTTDQRGVARPEPPGGRCDIGAYERALPVVSAGDAAVTGNIVLFGVMVSNPDPRPGTVFFQYGPTTAYGSATSAVTLAGNSGTQTYIVSAAGLTPGTYHFLAVATNPDGSSLGTDGVFTVAPSPPSPPTPQRPPPAPQASPPPSVTTGTATQVGAYSATLDGLVDPEGSATTAWFQYGTNSGYSSQTAPQPIGAGISPGAVRADLAGLLPGHTYYVRLVASNSAGRTAGSGVTFKTAARQRPASLGAKASPRTALHAPFAFHITGRLSLPAGLAGTVGCRGSVTLRALVGRLIAGSAHARVGPACRYGLRVTLHGHHLGSHGTARLLVSFAGNSSLARSSAPPLIVAFGVAAKHR